jgi:superfamily II DNA/RNA helicase
LDEATDLTNAIIFCNRKRDVATLYRSLERHGYSVGALHGDMDQYARLKTLDSFRDGQIKLLVASDVAARGLDIPAVSHIFNFDVPTHSEDYVHRIGRTGRAGRAGLAQTIVTRAESKYVQSIEKLTGKQIEWAEAPAVEEVQAAASGLSPSEHERGDGGRSGRRPGRKERQRSRGRRNHGGARERETTPAVRHTRERTSDARPSAPRPARKRDEDAGAAIGFSDHVPQFLLRPVRLPRDEPQVEEV